jgi:D-alanine-D-alanine ligase
MKKTVALVYGGEGREREISCLSAENLLCLIDENLYSVIRVEIDSRGCWYIREEGETVPTFPIMLDGVSGFFSRGEIIPVDCAIPCLHGDFGEDGIVQGLFSAAHIKYIGQDVYASALTSDKAYTKAIADRLGIKTARWIATGERDSRRARRLAEGHLAYPMFLKPTRLGSSIGARAVLSAEEFGSAYREAREFSTVLIEERIDVKCEIECALFDDGVRKLNPRGRIFSEGRTYDFYEKYSKESTTSTGIAEDTALENKIVEASHRLADFIGLRDLSRIDFFLCSDGEIYFNEINTFPGMTKTSLYPRLAEEMGISFINKLISRVTCCARDI